MNSPGEASSLLSYARLLRQSSDPDVKDHVYLNKHMTKAQAAHAFNMRVQRRKAAAESGSKPTSQEQSQSNSGSGSGSGSNPRSSPDDMESDCLDLFSQHGNNSQAVSNSQ